MNSQKKLKLCLLNRRPRRHRLQLPPQQLLPHHPLKELTFMRAAVSQKRALESALVIVFKTDAVSPLALWFTEMKNSFSRFGQQVRKLETSKQAIKKFFTAGANYVALALSDDRQMGRDSVIECVREGTSVGAYTSFTSKDDSPRISVSRYFYKIISE